MEQSRQKPPKRSEESGARKRGEGDEKKGRKPKPPPQGVPARDAALALIHMTTRGLTLNEAVETCKSFQALEGADRSFARALASTTLRRRGALDEVFESYLKIPLKPKQTLLRDLFRVTAAQLCVMDVDPHAAVFCAVEIAKLRDTTRGYKNLVNAVARAMSEDGKERLEKLPIRQDAPGWLWRRLAKAHGTKTAEKIVLAHRDEAPLDLSLKDPSAELVLGEEIEAKRIGVRTLRTASRLVPGIPGYEEGAFWVQDVAATLPAAILGATEGAKTFDLCAAPGGKTMQLMADGAWVTAVDTSAWRLKRLEANLQRVGFSASVVQENLLEWKPSGPAKFVLLDAPCSATGTIRRNPDLLWTSREEQLPLLKDLQAKMLDRAADLTEAGGTLVYAVCSLLPEEGEEQVEKLLARRDDLERVPVEPSEVGGLPVINKQGDIRCLPHLLNDEGGMDGFFAARLRKK
ncbi:RsmB/NOP family class I SAM-dependent RNA methyltransferase [Parvularcula maris]|uniref:RsmB/NOP family class I SAM-dependent RNA methyltransferase n=1 Tax=Parvularcula maris TaxID=2965077 RepID=A0A9X2L9W7_9PROT|nr:RsmB/NOP family class I SAM-dependent RNA methyltransferase [Parvularcula maris]MCQ8185810.1 RsmB/NOP family class I SAM-dependent RNA methyltransferase [Parvularcula maris]